MPAARVEILDDAGHLPQLDQPEVLARSIHRFFDESPCDARHTSVAATSVTKGIHQ